MLLLTKHLKSMPMHTFSAIRTFFVVFENYNNDYCSGCNATEILWRSSLNDLLQFPQRLAKTVPTTYQYVNPYYKNVQDC